jgi:NADPH:quinone reductase-like Zn-dependent oxidoreductase
MPPYRTGFQVKAYQLEAFNTVEGIVLRERDKPHCGPTEILVRVRAASLNRRDTMILDRSYPLPARPNVVPVSDGAGEVVAVGGSVTRFKPGDRVTGSYFARWRDGRISTELIDQLGCTLDGMLAEYILMDEQWAARVPEHLSWEEAATLSCAGVTAWSAVANSGAAIPGNTVLTLGTGGVSLYAIQFAKIMGCYVIAATSRNEKADRLRALGADEVINHAATPDWGRRVRELTAGRGVDLVVETIGPDTVEQSLIAASLYGQVVLLITRGGKTSRIEIDGLAWSGSLASIRRVFVGSRADLEAMNRAIAAHQLRPVIDRIFPFAHAHEAYRYFTRGDVFGKVVIEGA